MPAANDVGTEGGQNGPSDSVKEGQDAMLAIARHLGQRALSLSGEATPETAIQLELRSEKNRGEHLDKLLFEVTPAGVSPAIWVRWLAGGDAPFAANGIKKPVKRQQSDGKSLSRGPSSLRMYHERLGKARQELAFAEEQLAYYEALDKSLIEWCITDHMIKLIAPIFAMGPGWTVMRALSGHLSDENAEYLTRGVSGATKERALVEQRAKRATETEEMMEMLDLFSGHAGFERSIRYHVLSGVREWKKHNEEALRDGRKPRSKALRVATAHPKAQHDSAEVLAGLKRAG